MINSATCKTIKTSSLAFFGRNFPTPALDYISAFVKTHPKFWEVICQRDDLLKVDLVGSWKTLKGHL